MAEKVALIYTTFNSLNLESMGNGRAVLPSVSVEDRFYPPLGMLYLASVLESERIDVSFWDLSFFKKTIESFWNFIEQDKPRVVGIHVSTLNLPLVKNIIVRIKSISPQTIVVIGGPHVHYEPGAVVYLHADYGVVSDGEFAFTELVKALFNKDSIGDIPNVVCRVNNTVSSPRIVPIRDLDSIPFPSRRLWPFRIFSPFFSGKIATMTTSRGCPFHCAFCATPQRGSYRTRSVGNIIEELDFLAVEGVDHVDFIDDTSTFDRGRMETLCAQMFKKRMQIKWTCMSRIDTVDKALLQLMKKAGCTHIKYGIESGSERVRTVLMNKNITNQQIEDTLKYTRDAGLVSVGFFVLGMQGESFEEAEETLSFARNKSIDYVEFRPAGLLPGSDLFYQAKKEAKVPAGIWESFAAGGELQYSLLDKDSLTRVLRLCDKAMRQHYFNPFFLIKELFVRTDTIAGLFNKLKVVSNKRYASYLLCKIFRNFDYSISIFVNYRRLFLDALLKSIGRRGIR